LTEQQSHAKPRLSITFFILFLLSFLVIDVTSDILSTCFQDITEVDIDYEHTRPSSKVTKTPPVLNPVFTIAQISEDCLKEVFLLIPYSINSNFNFVQSGAKQAKDLTTIPVS
jgi:hypothetical protein